MIPNETGPDETGGGRDRPNETGPTRHIPTRQNPRDMRLVNLWQAIILFCHLDIFYL